MKPRFKFRPQFSLRSLFVATTLVALSLSYYFTKKEFYGTDYSSPGIVVTEDVSNLQRENTYFGRVGFFGGENNPNVDCYGDLWIDYKQPEVFSRVNIFARENDRHHYCLVKSFSDSFSHYSPSRRIVKSLLEKALEYRNSEELKIELERRK